MDALLGGLEISIVSKSHAMKSARTRRLDPEYFQKSHLRDEQLIQEHMSLFSSSSAMGISVDASAFYPSIEEFYDTGELPFYRVGDIDGVIDEQRALRIPEELCSRFPTLKTVQPGDIVFTKGGAIDRTGLVKAVGAASRDLIFMNTSLLAEEQQLTLFSYFRSNLFKRLLTRSSSQTAQPHLTITLVRELPFFTGSSDLRNAIAATTATAYQHLDISQSQLSQAEQRLTSALGLADWAPPEPLTYTASSADALRSGRLDAQYFMPAKAQVQEALRKMPGKPLSERFVSIRQMMDPKKEHSPSIVRNFDVTDALQPILDEEKEPTPTEEIGSMKKVFKNGDVVISRLRAYLREIAVVRTSEKIPSVGSSEFIVLRPRSKADRAIAPETLLAFLRSTPVQTILKWCQDGSQHPRFSEGDLLAINLPDAVEDVSAEIAAIVQEGFKARRKARILLDAAKRAVEIAIEENEAAALAYLRKVGTA